MTWHGVLGQLDVAPRGEPRLQRRRAIAAREQLARLRDELARPHGARQAELRDAVQDAEIVEREAWLAALVSVHREATPTLDWRAIAATPPPLLPAVDQQHSNEARRRLLDYRPERFGLIDRRRSLAADVERLVAAEEAERSAIMGQWRAQMQGWSAWCSLTARMLCNDTAAYREVVDASEGLDEIREVLAAESIELVLAPDSAEVQLAIELPREDERTREVLREYACAAPLRVARELLALLPIASVGVRASTRAVVLTRERAQTIDWDLAAPTIFEQC